MDSTRIFLIKDKLQKLLAAHGDFRNLKNDDDLSHQFILLSPLKKSDIDWFEAFHKMVLPEDYKQYLTSVSGGGAGPCEGLYPLDRGITKANVYFDAGRDGKHVLSENFPFVNHEVEKIIGRHTTQLCDFKEVTNLPVPRHLTGIIFLAECRNPNSFGAEVWHYFLVVKGEQAGTVWRCGKELQPCSQNGSQWSFFDWYENWLDESLRAI